ncbi:MAG: DUF3108 domain-containing protein [Bacteroidetes bacterium]|jgi:hypothetical protein|nr:DUF3108 domain-containing protein [Bacteroidota bacterium]MBT6686048.1 DUF3108 domain-containing protein [Bacteroidota bacterium]MBT7142732.1 DUF3108 domain-containing protein [Bacteroidota bacterium]MBT7491327.1 DUF3108 domain-containing protein [Bacteroidota bacterium]
MSQKSNYISFQNFSHIFILLFLFILTNKYAYTQQTYKEFSFKYGENIFYEVYYNLGFIYVKAGNVEFSVDSLNYDNQKIYCFNNTGRSLPEYDWFFKVRDRYQSFAYTNSLLPIKFYRENNEGDFHLKNQYTFDYNKNIIITETENSEKAFSRDTIPITHEIFDLLSATYYIRNLDFTEFKTNDSIFVSIFIDNEIHDLNIRFQGIEIITDRNKNNYECLKFSTLLLEGTIFNANENLTVWVSNDKNKVPILIEAKIIVGSIKVFLTEYSGLKYPFSSAIK